MSAKAPKQHGIIFHILDVAFNIVVIVAIVAGIRTFLVSPFQVDGSSMTDTLEDNEYIVINKLGYYIGNPERGDVIVFRPPNEKSKYYVKRIIGLPGDVVIIRDGLVFLQPAGTDVPVKLDEPYLDDRNEGRTFRHPPGSGDMGEERYQVPEDRYFVLGDNRQGSLDSRSFTMEDGSHEPYLAKKSISGKVWFVALPISKIHAFDGQDYNL